MRVLIIKKKALKIAAVCAAAVIGVALCTQISSGNAKDVFSEKTEEKMPVCSVETNKRELALTIDTAFGEDHTAEMLEILDKNNVTATFFVMGAWGIENPELVAAITEGGHEILSHSMTHIRYPDAAQEEVLADARQAKEYIMSATGAESGVIRLPYGAYDEKTLKALESDGFTPLKWSVDGEDWKTDDAKQVYNNVYKNAKGGDIIMLQNNTKSGAAALAELLPALKDKGYEFLTVSKLLPDGPLVTDGKGKATLFDE